MVSSNESTSGSTITTAVTQAATQANAQQRTDQGQRPNPNYRGGNPRNGVASVQTTTTRNNNWTNTGFKGDTTALNGHVFQCFEERRDPVQFTKTMEALNSYAKRDLKMTDLGSLFISPITQQASMPADVGANPTDDLKGHLAALHGASVARH